MFTSQRSTDLSLRSLLTDWPKDIEAKVTFIPTNAGGKHFAFLKLKGPGPARSPDQERGGPFGDHHRRKMGVGAWNYRDDGCIDDGEALDTDEPAARIDDGRRIIGRAHPARPACMHVVDYRYLEPRIQRRRIGQVLGCCPPLVESHGAGDTVHRVVAQ
jgi:hypothetical protein